MPGPAASCRFTDCTHLHEPDCGVRRAVADGRIAESRYQSYRKILLGAHLTEAPLDRPEGLCYTTRALPSVETALDEYRSFSLPNIKAAEKWMRQTEKRTTRNKDVKTRLKTIFKKAVSAHDADGYKIGRERV